MPEIYVSTDVEADGPIPGPNSMLSFGSAAYTVDKTLIGTSAPTCWSCLAPKPILGRWRGGRRSPTLGRSVDAIRVIQPRSCQSTSAG